jgi:tRNA A-37 threonylcarbamoyl transferase component Bud32
MSASERLEEGALLNGRYAILEVVGRGGMGRVYRALDTRLDITVAVKEMTERDLSPEDREMAVRQFEREAKLLGQLYHGNLPRVTDYFVEEEHCYLVMEFVVGRTIESLLRAAKGQAMPLVSVLDWAIQLSDVLTYLHGQDPPIVFRDIKPANIMLQEDGTVKLIDFGIARRFQQGATKDTLLYGSPGYSPPEQYGRAQTDPRSDIYALGATLHHLLTGRDPSSTPFKFPTIRSLNPDLPAALDIFISKCVEMDEEKRIQTAEEARDTLIHIRTDTVAAEQMAAARPVSGPSGPRPGTGKGSGPRVVSSRVQAVEQARTIKRLIVSVVVMAVVVAMGALAMKMRPKSTPKPRVDTAAPPVTSLPNNTEPTVQPKAGDTPATVRITTTPPGVTVMLDGKEVGKSPVELSNIAGGKHTLRLVPPSDSGLAEASRDINVDAGQTKEIETSLQPLPTAPTQASAPAATIQRTDAQAITQGNHPAIRIAVNFRVTGATGKDGIVGVFFYAADGTTPLNPKSDVEHFQNSDGHLTASQPFHVDADPADFPDFALTIPESVFPVDSPSKVTYRLVVYVDGKVAGQTDTRPLVKAGT